jgi:hypothetical protein
MTNPSRHPSRRRAAFRRSRSGFAPTIRQRSVVLPQSAAIPWERRENPRTTHRAVLRGEVLGFLTSSTSGTTTSGTSFDLAACYNYSDFVALYDQYRVLQIEAVLQPTQDVSIVGSGAAAQYPMIASAVDLDNITPIDYGHVVAQQGALESSGHSSHYHKWTPCVAMGAFNGSSIVAAATTESPWLNTSQPAIACYGLKMAASTSAGGTVAYNLSFRMLVEFRAAGQ